jgi:hypothetical protein
MKATLVSALLLLFAFATAAQAAQPCCDNPPCCDGGECCD